MSAYTALATRIPAALDETEIAVQRAIRNAEKAKRSGDDGYWDAVALNLHGFYTGVEHILEDIARTLEKSIPSGPDWHRDLLLQISSQANGVRPAVIQAETRRCLDEYRAFRHVVRNVYTFNLRPARLQELVTDLRACFAMVRNDLDVFIEFLSNAQQPE